VRLGKGSQDRQKRASLEYYAKECGPKGGSTDESVKIVLLLFALCVCFCHAGDGPKASWILCMCSATGLWSSPGYFLGIFYLVGAILGLENSAVNKAYRHTYSQRAYISVRGTDNK
jgi:hypothetical protein